MQEENNENETKTFSLTPETAIMYSLRDLKYGGELPEGLSLEEIMEGLVKQEKEIMEGNLDLVTRYLVCQGAVLNDLFENCIVKASRATNLHGFEAFSRIALKAQNQSRMTLESLANIHNPKDKTIIKQQNNAVNQQINNIPSKDLANEVLRGKKNETLDTRRKEEASPLNPKMETMETINRGKNG